MNTVIDTLTTAHDVLGDANAALRQCQATLAQLQRELATAEAAEAYWKDRHAEAWTFIGRLDYALEQIATTKYKSNAQRWAANMRAEIKAKVTP